MVEARIPVIARGNGARVSVAAGALWIVVVLSAACSGEPSEGPVEIHWDRDACERCRMVISDRRYAAQVRGGPKRRVYRFDDFGDAILWLDEQPWHEDPNTEFWVTDYRDGAWVEARRAGFVLGRKTPMDFGLGAVAGPVEGAMGFDEAAEHVRGVERARSAAVEQNPQ